MLACWLESSFLLAERAAWLPSFAVLLQAFLPLLHAWPSGFLPTKHAVSQPTFLWLAHQPTLSLPSFLPQRPHAVLPSRSHGSCACESSPLDRTRAVATACTSDPGPPQSAQYRALHVASDRCARRWQPLIR